MAADFAPGPVLLDVAAWLVTYALHSTVLLVAALCAFALIARASRRSPRVADAAPAWRERIGKVAQLAGIAPIPRPQLHHKLEKHVESTRRT